MFGWFHLLFLLFFNSFLFYFLAYNSNITWGYKHHRLYKKHHPLICKWQAELYTHFDWFLLMIRCIADVTINNISLFLLNKTLRFHVAMGLCSNRLQKTSKCGTLPCASCNNFLVVTPFLHHMWSITEQDTFLYLLNKNKYEIHKFTSIYIFAIILLKIIKRYSVGWKFL